MEVNLQRVLYKTILETLIFQQLLLLNIKLLTFTFIHKVKHSAMILLQLHQQDF